MKGVAVAVTVAVTAATVVLAGCAEPFRMHVDGGALQWMAEHGVAWTVKNGAVETHGWYGPNKVDTQYTHTSSNPPFPGQLVVISLRQGGGYHADELVAIAHDLLRAAAQDNMTIDGAQTASGERTLASGLETHWIVEQGTVTRNTPRGLFKQDSTVRLVAEVGYDGLSSTAVIAIGQAEVGSKLQCPLIGPCTPQSDLRTWNSLVGDPAGAIDHVKDPHGLLYNLVTHG